jgi:hypothetical protein
MEWVVDVLPNEVRDFLDGAMDRGVVAIKRALE